MKVNEAEGKGFEPSTPCGASDFEGHWTNVHIRSRRPNSYHVALFWKRPDSTAVQKQFLQVRRLGYKVATIANIRETEFGKAQCHTIGEISFSASIAQEHH